MVRFKMPGQGQLVNSEVVDERGKVYTIVEHHLEADEIAIEHGGERTAMTLEEFNKSGYELK